MVIVAALELAREADKLSVIAVKLEVAVVIEGFGCQIRGISEQWK